MITPTLSRPLPQREIRAQRRGKMRDDLAGLKLRLAGTWKRCMAVYRGYLYKCGKGSCIFRCLCMHFILFLFVTLLYVSIIADV